MIDWLRKLLCGNLFSRIEELTSERETLISNIKELGNTIREQNRDKSILIGEVESLEEQIEEMKNTAEFEEYLDRRYDTTTLVYTKRWILDKRNTKLPMDIRDFIQVYHTLPDMGTLEDIFKKYIEYVPDNYSYHGILDVWQTAPETWALRGGDCDDSGILRACLARRIGNRNVFCALGWWGDTGHLFNLMWKDGNIYILENTSNKYKPVKIDSIEKTGTDYKINYIFNENKVWVIDGKTSFGKKVRSEFGVEEVR